MHTRFQTNCHKLGNPPNNKIYIYNFETKMVFFYSYSTNKPIFSDKMFCSNIFSILNIGYVTSMSNRPFIIS